MTTSFRHFLFLSLLLVIPVASVRADLVNGSFSSPGLNTPEQSVSFGSTLITGWQVVKGYNGGTTGVVEYTSGISQDPGGYSVELGAYFVFGGLQQTFATLPNQAYAVTFWLATDPYNGPQAQMLASAGGTTVDFVAPLPTGNDANPGWQQESFVFTSDGSGSTTLLFQDLLGVSSQIPSAAFIDTVSVVAVPEPAGFAPIVLGMAVLVLRRKRSQYRAG